MVLLKLFEVYKVPPVAEKNASVLSAPATVALMTAPLIEVIKGLYLGNEIQAATRLLLIEHGVHFVLNAAGPQVANHFVDYGFQYLPLDLFDTTDDDITQFFDASYEFIERSQLSERGCLVHCKSGNSRAAAIVMSYLMRKYKAPLKEVFAFVLLRTDFKAKPNAGFLAQLVDYEIEMFGSSSMDDLHGTGNHNVPVLTNENTGLFDRPQGPLEDEQGFKEVASKVKALMMTGKWQQLSQMGEEFRDEDFGPWPLWIILLRRVLYQVVAYQMNFVVEKVPTPDNPTTMLIYNYIEQTKAAISSHLSGSSHGFLETLQHAVSHTLSIVNFGVGSIFIDHLSSAMGTAYRQVYAGKVKGEEAVAKLSNDLVKTASIIFSLFDYLQADSSFVRYLEQYENSLSNRLSLFLPIEHSPTSILMPVESEIALLVPHPAHVDRIQKMLADINKVKELKTNWESSRQSSTEASKEADLEVAILDSSAWPVTALTKALETTDLSSSLSTMAVSSIPATSLPLDIYPMWNSFKTFIESEGRKVALLPNLGEAQLTTTFGGKQYTLDVTTPMMLVLCSFNDNGESTTIEGLKKSLNLPSKLLVQTLHSLSQPSCQLLVRQTEKPDSPIAEEDVFVVNENFTSKEKCSQMYIEAPSNKN